MDTISFIHLSDTHIGDNKDFQLYGRNTFDVSTRLIHQINNLKVPFDFIIHSGDIVNNPDTASVQLAKSLFSKLNRPSYFINGNHDDPTIIDILQTGISKKLENAGSSRFFILKNFIFLILDTQGTKEIDPHGEFTKTTEKALANFLNCSKDKKIVLFIHFPPLPIDSPWIDRDMLILNGNRLHDLLVHSANRVHGVFFGHIHQQITLFRDGIFYASAPSPFSRFSILPIDQQVIIESDIPISFNYVTISVNDIIIKTITAEKTSE